MAGAVKERDEVKGGADTPQAVAAQAKVDVINDKMKASTAKAAAETKEALVKPYLEGFQQISAAFTSNFNSMPLEHKKFGAAFRDMWKSIATDALQALEKIAEQWAVKHVLMAAIHKVFKAQEVAADAAAAAASAAAATAQRAIQIGGSVALATSEVGVAATTAAAEAAIGGPAAAAAAGAIMVAALPPYLAMATFEQDGVVPRSGMKLLDEGERVLTPRDNQSFERAMSGGGGGDSHNITYNAAPGESPHSVSQNIAALKRALRDGKLRLA